MRKALDRKLATAFQETNGEPWVSIDIEVDGSRVYKDGETYGATLAQAKQALGGRVQTRGKPAKGRPPPKEVRRKGEFDVILTSQSASGNITRQLLGYAATERDAKLVLARAEQKLARFNQGSGPGWVAVDLYQHGGNRLAKGETFYMSAAQAKRVLSGRAHPAPAARAPANGRPTAGQRFKVVLESAKGAAKAAGTAAYYATEAAAIEAAKRVFERLEREARAYGHRKQGKRIRVDVITAERTPQVVQESRWVNV